MVDSQDLQQNQNGSTFDLAICLDSSDDEMEVWESPARTTTAAETHNSETKKRKRSETGCTVLASNARSFDLTETDDENDDTVHESNNSDNNVQQNSAEVINNVKQETNNVAQNNQELVKAGDQADGPITPTRKKRGALKTVNSKRPIERQRPNYLANASWLKTERSPQQENVPTPSVARMPSKEYMPPKDNQPAHQFSKFGPDSTVSRHWKTTGLDDQNDGIESHLQQDKSINAAEYPKNKTDEEYRMGEFSNDRGDDIIDTTYNKKRGTAKSVDSHRTIHAQQASPVKSTSDLKPPPTTTEETLRTQKAAVPSHHKKQIILPPVPATTASSLETAKDVGGDTCQSRRKLQRSAKTQITSLNESRLEVAAAELAEKEIATNQDDYTDEEAEDELADYTSLTRVEHLTSTTLCPETGLPILKFTCYGGADGSCFAFCVCV